MPSPQASRRNLTKVVRLRGYDERSIIKDLIRQWALSPTLKCQLKTQAAFARRLGVSQQYVSKIAKWTLWRYFRSEIRETHWQSTTLEELDKARERRLDFYSAPEPQQQEPESIDPDFLEEGESSEETFAPEPRREYIPPEETHTVAEWEGPVGAPRVDLMEELRRELRRPTTIRFRIPGFF